MGKRLTLILACALLVGLAVPAFAEVQNIKVSGDILVQGVIRENMDLRNGADGEDYIDDQINAMLSTVRLRVDADLTENVQAVVRLINERVWSSDLHEANDSGATAGNAGFAQDALVELDLAYLTLKEFLYEPLTLTIGRQPLRYGMGFIVGDPDTNQFSEYNHYTAGGTQVDTIVPEDLSSLKAFDAVKAVLNYDPLVIDLVYANISEGVVLASSTVPENDDVDLFGVNVAYDWGGDKNLASETYMFVKKVSSDGGTGGVTSTTIAGEDYDTTYTWGTRASIEPIERMYLAGEFAFQRGQKYLAANTVRDRKAYAYQIISQYALDMKYSPVLMGKFTHFQGDKDPGSAMADADNYQAWDPMFEDQSGGKIYNALFSATNCNVVELGTELMPLEDVKLGIAWSVLWTDTSFDTGAGTTTWTPNDYNSYTMRDDKNDLGQEIDITLTYDYTEDVQFGLNTGWFVAGEAFDKTLNREDAFQCIGSVKVNF